MSAWIAAAVLTVIAVIHSVLGELAIIGPLSRSGSWNLPIGRATGMKIMRFAWHLTSLAWIGLAIAVAGVPVGVAAGGVALLSGVIIFLILRTHLAWPLFLAAGLYALDSAGALSPLVPMVLVWAAVVIALIAAGFHVSWALGSRWGAAHVVPEAVGSARSLGTPGALLTLLVAVALSVLAALLWWTTERDAPGWAWWLVAVAALLLVVRSYGEGKYVGLLKTVRNTEFARRDDAFFTPLIVLLASGAISALHIAGYPA
jgi:hypothetical protein